MANKTETDASAQTNTGNQTNENATGGPRLPFLKRETTHNIVIPDKNVPTCPPK